MLKRFTAAALGCVLFISAAVGVYASTPQDSPVTGQTWDYLDAHPPGPWSISAYSLGGREIRPDAQKQLTELLDQGISSGFTQPLPLEQGIISLVKMGQDPQDYKKNNLLSTLYTYENLYRDGLENAIYALLAYQAAESIGGSFSGIPETARNSVASVTDYLISSQQRTGGFSLTPGRTPNVSATSLVLVALASKKDLPYVSTAIDKALAWLSTQQNPDGSFSTQGAPDAAATATALTALRVCGVSLQDPRFVKEDGAGMLEGLEKFRTLDGGYSAGIGGDSSPVVTELAVLALYTAETGISPFLAPQAYPGYVVPEPDSALLYLKFAIGFVGIFGLIYLILLLTVKIGKIWGNRPLKLEIPDPYAPDPPPQGQADAHTMEINIPMNAELPDFDTIHEKDAGHYS